VPCRNDGIDDVQIRTVIYLGNKANAKIVIKTPTTILIMPASITWGVKC